MTTRRQYVRTIGVALALAIGAGLGAGAARAQEAVVRLTLKDHKFQPAEARVAANKPVRIEIRNMDPSPAEFESKTLRVEKVVAGGASITVQVRALPPGRYRFFDDYHEDTTEGYLVVE